MGRREEDELRAACLTANVKRPLFDKSHNCMEYIENTVAEEFSEQEMARVIGYSPSYLSAKFKAVTGMTVQEYRNRCRMKEAERN